MELTLVSHPILYHRRKCHDSKCQLAVVAFDSWAIDAGVTELAISNAIYSVIFSTFVLVYSFPDLTHR